MNGICLSKTRREEHLKGTAELAKKFAEEFGCGEWGYLAGLWHVHRSRFVGNLVVHFYYLE